MSLYGSLFSAVSGLNAQSGGIGRISDNIANVNTVGYKGSTTSFETLVTSSGSTTTYSPGGVLGGTQQSIDRQGLINGTDAATDVAVSGDGFFVVNSESDAAGNVLYTRAGSFRQDSEGNLRNAAGYFLMAWPLDREGRLPGDSGNTTNTTPSANLSSLEVVNITDSSGQAVETTAVEISANLDAGQTVFPGSQVSGSMDSNNTNNANVGAEDIIIPSGTNSIGRGDKLTISTGSGAEFTYRYDGFTFSRNVATAAVGDSGASLPTSSLTLAATPFGTTSGSKTITVTATTHGLATGSVITISGASTAVNGIPAADFNRSFVVSNVTANTFDISVETAATSTGSSGDTGLTMITRAFGGNILDASSTTELFLSGSDVSDFTTASLSFTVTTQSVGTQTFTYTASSPNTQVGQFNNLTNLATAINSVEGLSARVAENRLYVSPVNANEAITFANGSTIGSQAGTTVLSGINWTSELGLVNTSAGDDRFSTLQGLSDLVTASSGVTSSIASPVSNATININVDDPLDTISFNDLATSSALTAFSSTSPFSTTSGSTTVTISHPAPHGFDSDDIVTLDLTGMTGYPSAFTATNVFATTASSTTVTMTQTSHGFTTGDTVFLDMTSISGYPTGNINGIPMRSLNAVFTVTVVDANTYTFTAPAAATSTASAGAGSLTVSPTFNGVPMTTLNGQFRISVSGPSTYTIKAARAATASGSTGLAGLVVTPHNNTGSMLAELGLVDSLEGNTFTAQSLGPLGPQYDADDPDKNMASGNIAAQYSQNAQVFDSLGTGHDVRISFIKVDSNTWAAEVYSVNDSEVSSVYVDGLLASGTLTFNGDGTLRSVSTGLTNAIDIIWSNGSETSSISIDWGTAGEPFGTANASSIGQADGLSQFDSDFEVNFINQDGATVGELVDISITEEGFVVAQYSNGETPAVFKIPIAIFPSSNQLRTVSGNVFSQTANSGSFNLREAGTSGAGAIVPGALESSNSDLATELTNLIVSQRAFQSNTKIITTADELLEEINRI